MQPARARGFTRILRQWIMRSVLADATNEAYAVRIAKGAGLIAETRDLLRAWQPGESAAVLAERVLQTDLLGKSTARRVKDIVQRVFAPRYLYPAECPALYLKSWSKGIPREMVLDLCLLTPPALTALCEIASRCCSVARVMKDALHSVLMRWLRSCAKRIRTA